MTEKTVIRLKYSRSTLQTAELDLGVRTVPGSQRDLLIYTLHRFAVTAAGQRLVFDEKPLTDTLDEAKIDSFRTLIDLDDAGQKQIGLKVMEEMKMARCGWLARENPSIGRLRPSMR